MRHGHLISSLTLHDLTRVKKVLWHEGAEKRPRHERIESRALHARPAYQTAHSVCYSPLPGSRAEDSQRRMEVAQVVISGGSGT